MALKSVITIKDSFEKQFQDREVVAIYNFSSGQFLVEAPHKGVEKDISDPFYIVTQDPFKVAEFSPMMDLEAFFKAVDGGSLL